MVKCLTLLVVIATVAAVPFKPSNVFAKEAQKLQMLNFALNRNDPSAISSNHEAILNVMQPKVVGELNERSFRLPNNTMPIHYAVQLRTGIHTGDVSFEGTVRVSLRVLEATNTVTLHKRTMIIRSVTGFNIDGSLLEPNLPFVFDSELEFMVISFSNTLQVNQEATIEISYDGILNTGNTGFFRSSYLDVAQNHIFWLASTNLQPIHARQAFPCYDEVRYRTTMDLSIRHHSSYNAVSNMPIASVTPDGDFVVTVFDQTPVIPVYILHFTISNFGSIINNNHPSVSLSVFARPEAIAAGQADNALELSEIMLRAVEQVFDIPFSLPKQDLIALTTNAITHNWGLITLGQNILLRVNDLPGPQHTREMWIAHANSHIFFANLVSITSWSYVWMNEGFAVLYENWLNDVVFPHKNQWDAFLINVFDTAINVDVLDNVQSLNHYVEAPAAIQAKWNFITFNKAAIVLRMFKEAITHDTFNKGIAYYINEMQFQSAAPEDLAAGLQMAYDEDFPGNDLNMEQLLHPWLNLVGFPVLTVSRTAQGLSLRQEGFRQLHNELFNIPINFATASSPNYENTIAEFWMTTREMQISRDQVNTTWTDDDWIIFNLRDTGYYVTNYDETLWQLIIDALMNDHEAIHFLNRGTLFADFHRFIWNLFDVRTTIYLEMMQSLPLEFHEHVWNRAGPGITGLELRLRGSALHSLFTSFMQDIMTPVYGRTFNNTPASNLVNRWSCLSGVQACLSDSLEAVVETMETGTTTFPFDFRCNGFMTANAAVWTHFFDQAMAMPPNSPARFSLLSDLICTPDAELIRTFLGAALNMGNNLTGAERISIITLAATQHQASYEGTIEFIEENHAEINENISNISPFVVELAGVTNTGCLAERVMMLMRFFPDNTITDRRLLIDTMQMNMDFNWMNLVEFHSWFEAYESRKNK